MFPSQIPEAHDLVKSCLSLEIFELTIKSTLTLSEPSVILISRVNLAPTLPDTMFFLNAEQNWLDLSRSKRLSRLHVRFQKTSLDALTIACRFTSQLLSTCSGPIKSIGVAFRRIVVTSESSKAMADILQCLELLDVPFAIPNRFPKLEYVNLTLGVAGDDVGDEYEVAPWTADVLPSVPSKTRNISVFVL